MTMRIESLSISLNKWGEDKDRLTGTAKFSGGTGEITLNIGHDQCKEIIALCADALVATSRETAKLMTTEILEHIETPQIEDGNA